jgi:hypothetical protein
MNAGPGNEYGWQKRTIELKQPLVVSDFGAIQESVSEKYIMLQIKGSVLQ